MGKKMNKKLITSFVITLILLPASVFTSSNYFANAEENANSIEVLQDLKNLLNQVEVIEEELSNARIQLIEDETSIAQARTTLAIVENELLSMITNLDSIIALFKEVTSGNLNFHPNDPMIITALCSAGTALYSARSGVTEALSNLDGNQPENAKYNLLGSLTDLHNCRIHLLNAIELLSEILYGPRFSPMADGFSFSNNDFTEKMKRPLQEIREQFSSSALASEIPQYQWYIFEYLLQAVEWTQKGYCGGMVKTAQYYYENPSSLPSGYSQTYDIPITETSTNNLIITNQWSQFIDGHGLFKWLLLRLGNELTGLVPSKEEIDWILEQLDERKTVVLTVFDPSLGWLLSHAVLAYDYEEDGNHVYLKVYGPNLGNVQNGLFEDNDGNLFVTDSQGGQIIHLVRNVDGSYLLDSGVAHIDGLKVTKLGSQEAPTWGLSVATLVPYMPEIVFNVMNYLAEETFIMFMAESPVDLLVTSPTSLSVGYDSETQTVVNEIEGAMYSGPGTEPQLIVIPNPMQGNYSIETFGTGDGDFTITVESVAPSIPDINVTSWTGTTSQGKLDTFGIELTEDLSVIPEFPSIIILLLFIITTIVVTIYKKKGGLGVKF
jgi:hypothetical protein